MNSREEWDPFATNLGRLVQAEDRGEAHAELEAGGLRGLLMGRCRSSALGRKAGDSWRAAV
jgi:hypothetical protein